MLPQPIHLEASGLQNVTISASLPFPVRVNADPYQIDLDGTVWILTFERIQRTNPDERIAGAGTTVDLEQDRHGQLAYSRVTGRASIDDLQEPLPMFLAALNRLILHFRDLFYEYWIRPVEPNDLYQVTTEVDGHFTHTLTFGRGGGATLPHVGLTDAANAKLVAALQSGKDVPVWRQMHLDARDALSLGRYEDCVVLTWCALETACRGALPGMAYSAGLEIGSLAARLNSHNRRQKPSLSYEEAVELSGGLKIVETAAELTNPQIYASEGVVTSIELAYRLRNKVAHQGARIYPKHAQEAWESVDFVLQKALSLRDIPAPPATHSWKHRFGRVRKDVNEFVTNNGLRLVFRHGNKDAMFSMESLGDVLWLTCKSDMTQPIASAFLRIMWDSWQRHRKRGHPLLFLGSPSGFLLTGSLNLLIEGVNSAVCFAESLMAFTDRTLAIRLARYAASQMIAQLLAMPIINPNDGRAKLFAARLAAFLAVLSKASVGARLRLLKQAQPGVAYLTREWTKAMAVMDPNDDHGRCAILRKIHADAFWLDSIFVSCPSEGVNYGSRRWPMD